MAQGFMLKERQFIRCVYHMGHFVGFLKKKFKQYQSSEHYQYTKTNNVMSVHICLRSTCNINILI